MTSEIGLLDQVFFSSDLGKFIHYHDYFRLLLRTLWQKGEGFSGKRPLGNSSWKYDIYKDLIKRELVKGKLDEYGYVEEMDEKEADLFIIVNLINKL